MREDDRLDQDEDADAEEKWICFGCRVNRAAYQIGYCGGERKRGIKDNLFVLVIEL